MGAVTTMVPVATAQVGCTVTDAVGGAREGTELMVNEVGAETQPVVVLRTVTL